MTSCARCGLSRDDHYLANLGHAHHPARDPLWIRALAWLRRKATR